MVGGRTAKDVALVLGEELVAPVGLEGVLHPDLLTGSVDPLERVRAVPVHVTPCPGQATVAQQPGDLVGRLAAVESTTSLDVMHQCIERAAARMHQ